MVSSRDTSFPAKLSHFFKIILSHNFKDTGLVELININNGEFWLKKGWPEFADRYSLQYGYFLVFRYEGNSVFNVIILDMSASEIEYPTKDHVNGDSLGADQGTQTDDHSTRKTYFLCSKKPKVESVIKSDEGKLKKEFQSSQTNMMKAQKGAEGIQTDDHSMRKKSPVTCFLRSKKTKVDSVINSVKGKLNEEFQSSQTNMIESQKDQEGIQIDDHSTRTRRKSPVTYLLRSKKAKVDPVIKSEEGKLNEEFRGSQTNMMKSQKGQEGIQIDDHSPRRKSPVTYFLRSKKPKVESVIESEEGKLKKEFQSSQTNMTKAQKGAEGIQTDDHSMRKTCFFRSKKTKVDSVINSEKGKLNEEFQNSQTNMMKSQKGQEGIQIDDHSTRTRRKSPVTYLLRSTKAKVDPVIKSEEGKLNEEFQGSQTDTMKASIKLEDMSPCLQEFRVNNVGVDTLNEGASTQWQCRTQGSSSIR